MTLLAPGPRTIGGRFEVLRIGCWFGEFAPTKCHCACLLMPHQAVVRVAGTYVNLGTYLVKMARYEEARDLYQKSLEINHASARISRPLQTRNGVSPTF